MIKKRGNVWVARVWDPQQSKQEWLGSFRTEKLAKAAVLEFDNRPKPDAPLTVNQLAEKWLGEWGKRQAWRDSTLAHNRERVAKFRTDNGTRRADKITVSEALTWATGHPSQLPALRAMFRFGVRVQALRDNPFADLGVDRRKPDRKRGALTEEQIATLAEKAGELHGPWHEAFVLFAAYTGLRKGEMFALRYADLGHGELTVSRAVNRFGEGPTKNGRSRTITYPRLAREAVQRMPRRPDAEHVFTNPRDGNPFNASSYDYYWRELRAGAGHKGLTVHELRHTCATIMLNRGVTATDVALQLGHVTANGSPNPQLVYDVYGHPDENQSREATRRLMDGNVTPLRSVTTGEQAAGGSA